MNTEFAVLVMDGKDEADKIASLSNQEFLEHFLQSNFRVRLEDVVVEHPGGWEFNSCAEYEHILVLTLAALYGNFADFPEK